MTRESKKLSVLGKYDQNKMENKYPATRFIQIFLLFSFTFSKL